MHRIGGVALLACAAIAPIASGDLVYEITTEFSGATAPEGPGPWLYATFSQTAQQAIDGELTLTMDATPLSAFNPDAHVKEWYFNVASPHEDNLGGITITHAGGTAADSVQKGKNTFQADGDGKYDILFTFAAGGSARFEDGETSVFTLAAAGISPTWFYALSAPGGGNNGPFYTALHVGGLGDNGDGSGWLTTTIIPLPSAAGMGLAGIGLLALRRAR